MDGSEGEVTTIVLELRSSFRRMDVVIIARIDSL